MFQEHFSFDKLVLSTSTFDELIEKFNAEVYRMCNTYCPPRTKQYSTHSLLNHWLTDETIKFVKFKSFLVFQVKANYIPKYILTIFKQELREKIDASKNHITPATSKLMKMILKKPGMILKKSAYTMTDIALTDHNYKSISHESVPESFAAHFSEVARVLYAKIPSNNTHPYSYLNEIIFLLQTKFHYSYNKLFAMIPVRKSATFSIDF